MDCWNTKEQRGEAREVFVEMVTDNKGRIGSPGKRPWWGSWIFKLQVWEGTRKQGMCWNRR